MLKALHANGDRHCCCCTAASCKPFSDLVLALNATCFMPRGAGGCTGFAAAIAGSTTAAALSPVSFLLLLLLLQLPHWELQGFCSSSICDSLQLSPAHAATSAVKLPEAAESAGMVAGMLSGLLAGTLPAPMPVHAAVTSESEYCCCC
jgi:hypothetical protein